MTKNRRQDAIGSLPDEYEKALCLLTKAIALILLVSVVSSCKTSHPVHSHKLNSAKLQDSVLMDSDGNKYAVKLLSDNNLWMTTNLKLTISGSYCYDNSPSNCDRYGRLYTWESAQKGCSLLGEGWRLPAKDEWQQLTKLYGGAAEDSTIIRKEAFKALLYTGASGFNALLGGGGEPDKDKYARLEAHGFYWTATEIDSSTAWYYNFAKGSQALYQQDGGEKPRAFSVRCVKHFDGVK